MKFGEFLETVKDWRGFYLPYDKLKGIVEDVAEGKLNAESNFSLVLSTSVDRTDRFFRSLVAKVFLEQHQIPAEQLKRNGSLLLKSVTNHRSVAAFA